jgi:hypothetical protein
MEVSGKIKMIGETQEFGSNGFKKREMVVTTNEQYPQSIMIEFTQNNTALLDSYKEGEDVTVQINLRGREWTNPQGEVKYFNSVNGWRIAKGGSQAAPASAPAAMPNIPAPKAADTKGNSSEEEDDLPF